MTSLRRLMVIVLFSAASLSCLGQGDPRNSRWTGTWGAAPSPAYPTNEIGTTAENIREIVHVSDAGQRIRVRISNAFGTEPLQVGSVSCALRGSADTLKTIPTSLSFDGREEVTIPAGESAISDPAAIDVPAVSDIAISIFVPEQSIKIVTNHLFANTTNYLAAGNQVLSTKLANPTEYVSWPFVTNVDVSPQKESDRRDPHRGSIVCLGDSITAGFHSTQNSNDNWPDQLANRLQSNVKMKSIGVLNEGIGGNRVLYNGVGPAALSRFDRDVLRQTNVNVLIISEGINDIGDGYRPKKPFVSQRPTSYDLESAYTNMAARAHASGIRVVGATLTPYGKSAAYSEIGEAIRKEVNSWIRTTALTSHIYDEVVDFDHVLRADDMGGPEVLSPLYDSGDGLHPNDAGYKVMAAAVDISFFDDLETDTGDLR